MKPNKIKSIVKEIFIKHKLSSEHAKICADALINAEQVGAYGHGCLLYTSPSPRDGLLSRMPSSA